MVITGGAGRLGSALADELKASGHEVITVDVLDRTQSASWVQHIVLALGDDPVGVIEGADLVVHTASLHPWKDYLDRDYLRANVEFTWMLYSALERAGVTRVILTSTCGVAGTPRPGLDWPVRVGHVHPVVDLYTITKRFQEEIAQTFATRGSVGTLAIRPTGFIPLSQLELGFALTRAFTILEEVVRAHIAALQVIRANREGDARASFDAVFVSNRLPYTRADGVEFARTGDLLPLIRRYWPHAVDWLLAHGFQTGPAPIVFDLEPARRLIGWEPSYGFDEWFDQHRDVL